VQAWLARVRALPGFVDDYVRYPENARPGERSLDLRLAQFHQYQC
jgi:hypothetical protein